MPRTEIPLSKSSMFFSFCACLLFVITGIYLLVTPPDPGMTWQPFAIKAFAVVVILFFGLLGWAGAKIVFNTKPALIIDERGITDNTSTAAVGFIPWEDVKAIRHFDKEPKEYIVIDLIDPDTYINRQENIRAKWIRENLHITGSPVSIAPNTIQYNFLKLQNLINAEFERYKSLN